MMLADVLRGAVVRNNMPMKWCEWVWPPNRLVDRLYSLTPLSPGQSPSQSSSGHFSRRSLRQSPETITVLMTPHHKLANSNQITNVLLVESPEVLSNPQKRRLVCVSPPKRWFNEPFSGGHLCRKPINLTRQGWGCRTFVSQEWHFLQRLLFLVGWTSEVAEWLSVGQRTLHVHSHLCFFVSFQTLQ